jgi:hypothetical protein
MRKSLALIFFVAIVVGSFNETSEEEDYDYYDEDPKPDEGDHLKNLKAYFGGWGISTDEDGCPQDRDYICNEFKAEHYRCTCFHPNTYMVGFQTN